MRSSAVLTRQLQHICTRLEIDARRLAVAFEERLSAVRQLKLSGTPALRKEMDAASSGMARPHNIGGGGVLHIDRAWLL
jgi:hypothetical protein